MQGQVGIQIPGLFGIRHVNYVPVRILIPPNTRHLFQLIKWVNCHCVVRKSHRKHGVTRYTALPRCWCITLPVEYRGHYRRRASCKLKRPYMVYPVQRKHRCYTGVPIPYLIIRRPPGLVIRVTSYRYIKYPITSVCPGTRIIQRVYQTLYRRYRYPYLRIRE
jgi:hypothetical protein